MGGKGSKGPSRNQYRGYLGRGCLGCSLDTSAEMVGAGAFYNLNSQCFGDGIYVLFQNCDLFNWMSII